MQKLSRSLIALGGLAALAACGDDVSITPPAPTPAAVVTAVTVSPAAITLKVGETSTLGVSVATTGPGVATTVTWGPSSNNSVATVSATGVVTAVGAGNATIRATSTADASKSGAAQVTVTAPSVQSVTVNPSVINLTNGGPGAIAVATVARDAGVSADVNWSSSAPTIASVTKNAQGNGAIAAVAPGTAVITATSSVDATKSATLTVNVSNAANPLVSMSLLPNPVALGVGGTQALTTNVNLSDGSQPDSIRFGSSAPLTVSVNPTTGLVTAIGNGSAVITATAYKRTISNQQFTIAATTTVNVASASVSIASVTAMAAPVTLNNVAGQIEVTANINAGNQNIERIVILLNGIEGSRQTFTVNGAPNAPVTLSINTASFNPTTFAPTFLNGNTTVKAQIFASGQTAPAAENSIQITLNNADIAFVTTNIAPTVPTPTVSSWYTGGFTYNANVVAYSGTNLTGVTYTGTNCSTGSATGASTSFSATFGPCSGEGSRNPGTGITFNYTVVPSFSPANNVYQATTLTPAILIDNQGPAVGTVSISGPSPLYLNWLGSLHGFGVTYVDGGVGPTVATAGIVDGSNNGGTSYSLLALTTASQLTETTTPTIYSFRGRDAMDLLGNSAAATGSIAAAIGSYGVDLQVTDAQFANRTTSGVAALAGIFPLTSNATIYTGGAWTTQEGTGFQNLAVDAIDNNGSGLNNATALTQSLKRYGPFATQNCLTGTYAMNTGLATDNYAQSALQQLDCGNAVTLRTGRYTWTASVADRAYNSRKPKGGSVNQNDIDSVYVLIDEGLPNITGIGFQTSLYTAGQPASFSFSANDDYEIKDGQVTLAHGQGTWANAVPQVTYPYGSSAYTVGTFSASPWDATYVNVLNGSTLTLGYLLGAYDALPDSSTGTFVSSGILAGTIANVRDWANQSALAPIGNAMNVLPTQVAPTAAYAWATTAFDASSITGNMQAFQITAKTAGTSVTVQQIGSTSGSKFACSRIDIFEVNALAVVGTVDAATTTSLTYVGTKSFTSVNFQDNGGLRFHQYGAITVATTGGSGLYTAACVMGGRALLSPIF